MQTFLKKKINFIYPMTIKIDNVEIHVQFNGDKNFGHLRPSRLKTMVVFDFSQKPFHPHIHH